MDESEDCGTYTATKTKGNIYTLYPGGIRVNLRSCEKCPLALGQFLTHSSPYLLPSANVAKKFIERLVIVKIEFNFFILFLNLKRMKIFVFNDFRVFFNSAHF